MVWCSCTAPRKKRIKNDEPEPEQQTAEDPGLTSELLGAPVEWTKAGLESTVDGAHFGLEKTVDGVTVVGQYTVDGAKLVRKGAGKAGRGALDITRDLVLLGDTAETDVSKLYGVQLGGAVRKACVPCAVCADDVLPGMAAMMSMGGMRHALEEARALRFAKDADTAKKNDATMDIKSLLLLTRLRRKAAQGACCERESGPSFSGHTGYNGAPPHPLTRVRRACGARAQRRR